MYQKIIFCNCKGGAIGENVKKQALDLLQKINSEIIEIDDLCGLCASDKSLVKKLFKSEGDTLILACHSRAIKMLLGYAGMDAFDNLTFLNLRDDEAVQSLTSIEKLGNDNQDKLSLKKISTNSDWPAWYPVLDNSRCTACGQCADFCLFGVYKKEEGVVEVINPGACKNNCPACARICPQIAIVFPKYVHGGAISGSDVFDEQVEQKRQLEDMDKILGSDIYQALEQRKVKRQSIIKTVAMKKALEERNNALNERKN